MLGIFFNYLFKYKTVLTFRMEPHQIIIIIILVLIETLGNAFLFGIFIYEKYGISANRRTVQNMLVSKICLTWLYMMDTSTGHKSGVLNYSGLDMKGEH